MAIYRAREMTSVWVEALGREVKLDPARELDDQFPEDAAVIEEWAHRGLVRAPNVEQATAAPGERRTTRRKSEEAA